MAWHLKMGPGLCPWGYSNPQKDAETCFDDVFFQGFPSFFTGFQLFYDWGVVGVVGIVKFEELT